MDVYFVRHGQTDGNVAGRHQHPDTPLNELGKKQVEIAAWEISSLKPTHIISSTQLRAVQSTQIISSYCEGVIPDTHPAFEELVQPKYMIGNRYVGFSTLWYVFRWFIGKESKGGESYLDFLARLKEAKTHLERLPLDARVIVVSHSVFTNFFIEHLCSEKPMSLWRAVKRFFSIMTIRNATIIHLQYSALRANSCGWHLVSTSRVYPKLK